MALQTVTFLTCLVKEKSESNQTPKFLTASEGISDSPIICLLERMGLTFFVETWSQI